MKHLKAIFLSCLSLLFFSAYSQVTLIKDIYPGFYENPSFPESFARLNSSVLFVAQDDVAGKELWVSDGTLGGTKLLKDFYYGVYDSDPFSLVEMNGYVYFGVEAQVQTTGLWRSDGTEAGTELVYAGGIHNEQTTNYSNIVKVNNTIYFVVNTAANGNELWKSDGTSAGTMMVLDINPGTASSTITNMTEANGMLYFMATNGTNGYELWKSDGTSAGTVMVSDINPGSGSSVSTSSKLVSSQGKVFFAASTTTSNGSELWVSDGTAAGTNLVLDIYSGSISSSPQQFIDYNGALYFQATTASGQELWKSNGTAAGTVLLKDINAGANGSYPKNMTLFNGLLFFSAISNTNQNALWKTDGTAAGTVVVKSVTSGGTGSMPTDLYPWNGILYFQAQLGNNNGRELWKSDGTSAGTVLVKEISAGVGSGSPKYFIGLNGFVLFQAGTTAINAEIWKSDGTSAGTAMLKNIKKGMNSNMIDESIVLNNKLYFSAYGNDTDSGELWSTDGTNTGTVQVKNISPSSSSSPQNFCKVGSTIFFSADDGSTGRELWKSDGTSAGTLLVRNLASGNSGSNPANLIELNGQLLFKAFTTVDAVYKSNGTSAGTTAVRSHPYITDGVMKFNGNIYYVAQATSGYSLCKSNGTAAGSVGIITMAETNITTTGNMIEYNNYLYFARLTTNEGVELWKTDGTAAGSVLVKDIRSGTGYSYPRNFAVCDGKLFFTANNGVTGEELWVTDGTTVGTQLFMDINPGANGCNPRNFCVSGNQLFFSANDGTHGNELWKTDGSLAGTNLFYDIFPGMGSGDPLNMTSKYGFLYFTANNGITGYELWKSNGTPCGTNLVQDVNPGNSSSFPKVLGIIDNQLILNLYTESVGYELYKYTDNSINSIESCGPYTWASNSQVYNQSGVYYDTLQSTLGCDSILVLDLIVHDVMDTTIATVCATYTWTLNGQTYTQTGIYNDTIISSTTNCPIAITLDLTILDPHYDTLTVTSCSSYLWAETNQAYTSSGIYDHVLVNQAGCDSIITLNLTVLNNNNPVLNHTACNSYTWSENNVTYNQSGTYSASYTDINGCDSTIILNLTIGNPTSGIDIRTACNAYTWINGTTYTSSTNTPTFILQNSGGCDSTVTLNLTIKHSTSGTDIQTACDSYDWIDGNTYTSSTNTPTFVLQNAAGCDSTVTLNLTITNSTNETDIQTACDSYDWIDGNTYTSSTNTPTFVLQNAAGCDSIVTLNLTITHSTTGTDVQTACDSYDWIDGNTYTSSTNTLTFVLQNASGCDSTVTLNLTITHSTTGTDTQTACDTYDWIDGNTYISSTNTPTFVLQNASDCDSIVTLNLTITHSTTGTDVQTACDTYDWIDGNTYTSSTNTPTVVLQNAVGCDSTVTLNLTITHSTTGIDIQTACDSYDWIDGNTYASSTNTPTFVLQNAAGCDSIVTLNLTITHSTTGTDVQTVCDSYDWIDGNTYTSSTNTPTFVLQNAAGCDSTVTLNLTITHSNIGTDVQTACDSYDWIDGNTYTSSTNTPTFVLQNAAGCDSTVTLNLSIITSLPLVVENVFVFPSDVNTCVGEAAITVSGNADFELDFDNGSQVITSSGYSLVTGLCAGVHDLHVTDNCGDTLSVPVVIPVDSNFVFNNPFIDSLAQDSLGVTMTNCDIFYNSIDTAYIDSIWATGNTVNVIWNIVDSNGSNFDTTSYVLNNGNGVYWVQLSVFCPLKSVGEYFTVTEAIYFNNGSVSTAGLVDVGIGLLEIYPNPTNDRVYITLSGSEAELTVYDVQGKVVLIDHIQNQGIISLQNFERGVYLFEFKNSQGQNVKRIVKQ